jgi:hypothetical protein
MKFYRLVEISIRDDELVCKASTTGAFIWPILYAGIGITLLLFGINGANIYGLNMPSGLVFYGGAVIFGLMGWAAWWNHDADELAAAL